MREQLIRYLLGELDADERRDLQSRLQEQPGAAGRAGAAAVVFCRSQDEDLFAPDAPSGLAARTAERVTGGDDASEFAGRQACAGSCRMPAIRRPEFLGWSLADLTVAGGVMLAVSMLIFPALRNSRDGTRRSACVRTICDKLGV